MRTNTTKKRLQAGETVFGCWLRYADPALVEFVGYQGWDFVVLDGEHGTLDPRECENAVRAAELRAVTPLVRVTANEAPVILRYMDTGAQGAHIPMVDSAADAKRAVSAVKYAPRGSRGLAAARAAGFGQEASLDEYIVRANEETLVVIQIETPEAVAALPAILKVPDVDVVFLGLTDLSLAMGVPGQTSHPDVERAVQGVLEMLTSSRCALGVLVSSGAAAETWRERGARYIAISLEALIRDGSRDLLSAVRP